MKPRAYSYVRFSSPEQATGDSLRRQTDAARRYAAANGFELDDSLNLQDLGRSAYAGHHVQEGALGAFLAACEAGIVPKKSVLIVEAVDRLTRLDHVEAMTLISKLTAHVDLHVVQLGRTFTDEIVRHDMGAIFTLVGAIALGHQESQQKGSRVGHAWEQKRKAAETGQKYTSRCPAWLQPIDDGFKIIPKRAKVVREIFTRFVGGESQQSIVKSLNERKEPIWGRGARWNRSYVCKILRNEAVVGVLQVGRKRKVDPARIVVGSVEDYYPAAIDRTLFSEAASMMKSNTRGRRPSQNPMAGVLRCPHCGGTVTREHKGKRARPKLVCASVRDGGANDKCEKLRVDLERYWEAERANLMKRAEKGANAHHPAPIKTLAKDANAAREELEAIKEQVAQLASPSAFLIGEVGKLEARVETLDREIRDAGRDVSLGWENLREVLADDSAEPAEISARLRAVFPDGMILDLEAER